MCTSPYFRIQDKYGVFGSRRKINGAVFLHTVDEYEFYKKLYPFAFRDEFVSMIGCGQCVECRLAYSKRWALRVMAELETSFCGHFLTLTYDNDHLPMTDGLSMDRHTGEIDIVPTLVKRDVQLFFKRLRAALEYRGIKSDVRYLLCGEYGSHTFRPHYHVCLFNVPFWDLQVFSKRGSVVLYTSEFLSDVWKQGFVTVGELTFESAAYVARYVLKKQTGKAAFDYDTVINQYSDLTPQEQEFLLMSRKPGLGREYYEIHKDEIFQTDEIIISGCKAAPKSLLYYDRLFDIDNPDAMEKIKNKRKRLSKISLDRKLRSAKKSLADYNDLRDQRLQRSLKKLPRDL